MLTVSIDQLTQAPLFSGVDESVLTRWMSRVKQINLSPGECLLVPGQRNDRLFILIKGKMKVSVTHKNSDPLAYISTGQCVGELSCLDGGDVTSYVCATEPCHLICLDSDATHAFVRESHAFCLNLLLLQANRFRQSVQALRNSRATEASFRLKAETDDLTGLFNRAWFARMMSAQLTLSESSGQKVCLAMIDLDNFKQINDNYGHLTGDAVLKFVGHFFRTHTRQSDAVARYGGEEFVVMMTGPGLDVVIGVLDHLRKSLSEQSIDLPDGNSVNITFSAGVSEYQAGDTLEELISRADQLMYSAKKAGRNCVMPPASQAKN
jgi:diguanylate cyclase (GGDEF)-like protein